MPTSRRSKVPSERWFPLPRELHRGHEHVGSVVYPLKNEQKKSRVRVPPDVVLPLPKARVEKRETSGESHDKIILDQESRKRSVPHESKVRTTRKGGACEGKKKTGAD